METVARSSRQDRRKSRTAGAILDAAEALFLSGGYHPTTIEQLADHADVSVGSVYGHYGAKEGVYAALVDRALALDKRYCDQGWESGSTALERLVGLSESYLRFARDHPGHFRVFRFPPVDAPSGGQVTAARERVRSRIEVEVDRMAGAIGQAAADGVLRPVDPGVTAVFLWGAWDGIIANHVLPGNMELSEEKFESVLAVGREVLALGLLANSDGGAT